MHQWAKWYHEQGWQVLPVHYPVDGHCSCPLGKNCESPAKHPAVTEWQNKAATGLDVDLWWIDHPQLNIGIHCANLFVVDLDGPLGIGAFKELRSKHNTEAPMTPTARTGSGGFHLYFKGVEGARNRVGVVPGVDIRAKGGQVIAPPSENMKGIYEWVSGRARWHVPLAEAPAWLAALTLPQRKYDAPSPQEPWAIDEKAIAPIEQPGRNNALAKICGKLFRARSGCGTLPFASVLPQVEKDLMRINNNKCRPPLPSREVAKIAWSISRKG